MTETPAISPCLWFDSNAEEAVAFYMSVFTDSRIMRVARYGEGGPGPAGAVMTIEFDLDGRRFVALNGGPAFQFSEAVSFVVSCATQDEIDRFWERLSEGGEKRACGWLKDRFGLSWQIVPRALATMMEDPDAARTGRVTQAMLRMTKLDLAALVDAYNAA